MNGDDPNTSSSDSSTPDPAEPQSCSIDDPSQSSCSIDNPSDVPAPADPQPPSGSGNAPTGPSPAPIGPDPAPACATDEPAGPAPAPSCGDSDSAPPPEPGPSCEPDAPANPDAGPSACDSTEPVNTPTTPDDSGATPTGAQYGDADDAAGNSCREEPVDGTATCGAPKSTLAVKVTDYSQQPIRGATVTVAGLGAMTTDKYGLADFGEVAPGSYNVTVEKRGYRPAPNAKVGPATTIAVAPAGMSTIVPVKLDVFRENILFCGSEMDYDSFWLKMMFVASAWFESTNGAEFRNADRKTIAYVDVGYTNFEKLTLDFLRDKRGFNVVKIASGSDMVKVLNDRFQMTVTQDLEAYLIQDVAVFSHGVPGALKLNYNASPSVDFTENELASADADAFAPDGRFYSYACRTGVSSLWENFSNDDESGPSFSLAQKIADHFQVETHAFLTRSFYGEVLREKKDSATIAATLKTARETQEGQLIDIPPEHQGLPHPGLSDGWTDRAAKKEGTNKYALWRKDGGIRLPRSGDTPKGLTPGLRVFNPT